MDSTNNLAGINPKLTLEHKSQFFDSLNMLISCEGEMGVSILNRKDPILNIRKPDIKQKRVIYDSSAPSGTREIEGSFTFATQVMSNDNPPIGETDAEGNPILEFTTSNFEAYDKAVDKYKDEVAKVTKLKAKISRCINSSISINSIAILKSEGLTKYTEALTDPVKMLILIDSTHQQSDNTNMVKALTDVIECKHDLYDCYPSHIAAFERLVAIANDKFGSSKTLETTELFNKIIKCILTVNVDQSFFQFVIQSIHAAKVPSDLFL